MSRNNQQKPYIWYDPETSQTWTNEALEDGYPSDGLIPLYEAPQPLHQDREQPVAWIADGVLPLLHRQGDVVTKLTRSEQQKCGITTPLYAVQSSQRKRSQLTDDEIDAIAESMPGGLDGFLKGWGWRQFARAVERAYSTDAESTSNLTMCADAQCPEYSTCYRSQAKPAPDQRFWAVSPREGNSCRFYAPIYFTNGASALKDDRQ